LGSERHRGTSSRAAAASPARARETTPTTNSGTTPTQGNCQCVAFEPSLRPAAFSASASDQNFQSAALAPVYAQYFDFVQQCVNRPHQHLIMSKIMDAGIDPTLLLSPTERVRYKVWMARLKQTTLSLFNFVLFT
jgi:hypothetical protein